METDEQKAAFKVKLASTIGVDSDDLTILDVFAGSINLIYDISAEDSTTLTEI